MNYDEFREQYENQHPASVPKPPAQQREFPVWLAPLTLVMFVAASIVSGAHTISTVRTTLEASLIPQQLKNAIATSAYFAFELALFVSVFSWLRRSNRWLSYISTAVVFVVIMLANLQDVARSIGSEDWMTILIVIGTGVGTPLVALLSGKLFVDIYRTNRNTDMRLQAEYQEELKQWDSTILGRWTTYQKEQKKLSENRRPQAKTSASSVGTDRQQTDGYTRVGDATDRALEYLESNPDAMDKSLRDLADIIGVGKDSVNKAKHLLNGKN